MHDGCSKLRLTKKETKIIRIKKRGKTKFLPPSLLKSALAARANAAVWEGPSARNHNTHKLQHVHPQKQDKYWHSARMGQATLSGQLEKQQRVYGNSLAKSNFFGKAKQRKG